MKLQCREGWRLLAVLALAGLGSLPAQSDNPARVDVQAVRLHLLAPAGPTARWLEIDVQVSARFPGTRSLFLDRVRVTLELGTRVQGGGHRYYRADLEVVALPNGPANFRFYLPPEVVQRDGLGGETEFWSVAITAGGAAVPVNARNFSISLREPEALRRFESNLAAAAPGEAGVLVPQYLSPFEDQYPGDTPSPIRPR